MAKIEFSDRLIILAMAKFESAIAKLFKPSLNSILVMAKIF